MSIDRSRGSKKLVKSICAVGAYVLGACLLIFFAVFVVYIVYELHQFIPIPPRINLECARYMDNSVEGQGLLADYVMNRSVHEAPTKVLAGCWGIKKRRYFPIYLPARLEFYYPIYFIRLVGKHYSFMERTLSMMYSPSHFYCMPVEANSTPEFEAKVRNLGMCMLNVVVPPGKFNGSDPIQYFAAQKACLAAMPMYDWQHLAVLMEADVPLQAIQRIGEALAALRNSSRIGLHEITENQLSEMTQMNATASVHLKSTIVQWWQRKLEPLFISRHFSGLLYDFIDKNLARKDFTTAKFEAPANQTCRTEHFDEFGHCVHGMEDLADDADSRQLFARADPDFDLGYVDCIHEMKMPMNVDAPLDDIIQTQRSQRGGFRRGGLRGGRGGFGYRQPMHGGFQSRAIPQASGPVRVNIANLYNVSELFVEYPHDGITVHYDEEGLPVGTADIHFRTRPNAAAALIRDNEGLRIDGRPLKFFLLGQRPTPINFMQKYRNNTQPSIPYYGRVRGVGGIRKRGYLQQSRGAPPKRMSEAELNAQIDAYMGK
ncbi:unnamed protein product, partial [Mesorhabditis spiculigera]